MTPYQTALKRLSDKFESEGLTLRELLAMSAGFAYGWNEGRHAMNAERVAEQIALNKPYLAAVHELNVHTPGKP